MLVRRLVLATTALALAATPAAVAEPKRKPVPRACGHSDPSGDAAVAVLQPGAADIVCAGLAVTRTGIVAALRLRDLGDRAPAGDHEWQVSMTFRGVDLVFTATQRPTDAGPSSSVAAGTTTVPSVIRVDGDTLFWHVRRRDVPHAGPKPSQDCAQLTARTSVADLAADSAGPWRGKACAGS